MPADVYLTLPEGVPARVAATVLDGVWWNDLAVKWVDLGNNYWLRDEGRSVIRLSSRYGNTEQFTAYKAALLALGCVEVPSA